MFKTKTLARNLALAGATTLLLGSSAFAQDRHDPRTYQQGNRSGFANRVVDGTVVSVVHERNGDRVKLASGMDLWVPETVVPMNQGRRFGISTLRPGDIVRMNVYSREGDGRDAQVRSVELIRTAPMGDRWDNNNRLMGSVVSYDRRARLLVVQTENGRTMNVDLNVYSRGNNSLGMFRRGDRVSITGRLDRGKLVAEDVRMAGPGGPGGPGGYDHRH